MKNHKIYGENAEKHADRTELENLSSGFIDMMRRFCQKSSEPVLDVGCGVGRDVRYMNGFFPNGSKVYGVDASEQMIEEAKSGSSDGAQYLVGDMNDLPFGQSTIGGLWCQATIFMTGIEGMKETMKEFHRVLRDDGVAAVSFKVSDEVSDENGVQHRERWGEEIQYYFVDQEIADQIADGAGFHIEDTDTEQFGSTEFYNVWVTPK